MLAGRFGAGGTAPDASNSVSFQRVTKIMKTHFIATFWLFSFATSTSHAQYLITTAAGGGGLITNSSNGAKANAAFVGTPYQLAVDASGNVYVPYGSALLEISPAGILTFAAGNPDTRGNSGDGGPAANALLSSPSGVTIDDGGNIYIADPGNGNIRKIGTDGTISTVAQINAPGIAVDANGNLYVPDGDGCVIRKVDKNGNISVFAGNGKCTTSGDGGLATSASTCFPGSIAADPSGNVYWVETPLCPSSNQSGTAPLPFIRKVDAQGIISSVTADTAFVPLNIAVDSAGEVYDVELIPDCARKLSTDGTVTVVAGNGQYGFSGDGGPATQARLYAPSAITLDSKGNIYIADGGRIRMVNQAGIISTIAGPDASYYDEGRSATSVVLSSTNGVATAADGSVYVSSVSAVFRVSSGGIISTLAGNGMSGFSGDGGPATSAELGNAIGLATDPSGSVYIADSGNNRIRKVSSSGTITTVAGSAKAGFSGDGGPAIAASLQNPQGIALDTAGNLYIADTSNQVIRKVNPQGIITTVAGNGQQGSGGDGGPAIAAQLSAPCAVAVDGSGNLYIVDGGNDEIRKVDNSGIITKLAGTGQPGYSGDGGPATAASLAEPSAIALDAQGNIFILDSGNNMVRMIDQTGTISMVGLARANGSVYLNLNEDIGFCAPDIVGGGGIAFDPSGNLYIADWLDGLVLKGVKTSTILLTSAVNTATFSPASPQVAPGSLLTLLGLNLAGTQAAPAPPLSNQIGDTSVTINNLPAPLLYTSSTQINLQIPFDAPLGSDNLVLTRSGVGNATIPVSVAATAPAIFAVVNAGPGIYGGPGTYVSIYCTGLGDVTNRPANGAAAPGAPYSDTLLTPTVAVGGTPATVTYSGLAPTLVGVYQVNAFLPLGTPLGYGTTLTLAVGGASATAPISLQ
jgi:uncharacterized protein (TIGR03437 family)